MHAVTFFVALPASVVLIALSDGPSRRAVAVVYAASLLAVFGTSALYHRFDWSARAHRLMQRLDHSMIYVLIAGTYVPFCVIVLPPAWGIPILAFVGVGAVTGTMLKMVGNGRVSDWASALYPILGWAVAVATPVLVDNMAGWQFALVVLGGLAYTVGFPVLFLRRPDPWPTTFGYHEIWHTCTVVAAVLHFVAVTSVLVS